MRPCILCRERLERIQRVLERAGEVPVSVRDFRRRYDVWDWELRQAAALGWVEITVKKPRTGRPSSLVKLKEVSEYPPAKPPRRCDIARLISCRHFNFAMHSVCSSVKRGSRTFFHTPPYTDAYLKTFPQARKRRAATSSMSRLLKHPHVKAARAWFYAKVNQEIGIAEGMPDSVEGIRKRLITAGSRFAFRF